MNDQSKSAAKGSDDPGGGGSSQNPRSHNKKNNNKQWAAKKGGENSRGNNNASQNENSNYQSNSKTDESSKKGDTSKTQTSYRPKSDKLNTGSEAFVPPSQDTQNDNGSNYGRGRGRNRGRGRGRGSEAGSYQERPVGSGNDGNDNNLNQNTSEGQKKRNRNRGRGKGRGNGTADSQSHNPDEETKDYQNQRDANIPDDQASYRPQTQQNNRGRRGGNKGRGGQHQQQYDYDSKQDYELIDVDPESFRGGRGNRGRGRGSSRGNQNQYQQRPQTSNNQRDGQNNTESNRADQTRHQNNNKRLPNDQFYDRQQQNKRQERYQQNQHEHKLDQREQALFKEDAGFNGRKQTQGSQGGKQTYKNLGSATKFIGDVEKEKTLHAEKLKYTKKDNGERNRRDKASIKYNFKDFLSQYQNLSDQCQFFVKGLCEGTTECSICSYPVYQRSAIWNCRQCYQPFHMGCIKRWIKKQNQTLKQAVQQQEDEERKDNRVNDGEHDSDQDEDYGDQIDVDEDSMTNEQKIAKKLTAFYSWTCPNCNFAYAQNKMPVYACYCGAIEEPSYNPLTLPHSCGEYCNKQKNPDCTHEPCEILCHPGSCPPCTINVTVQCHCGKKSQRVPCQVAKRTKFSCQAPCGRLLNCMKHRCEDTCHEGPCKPCDKDVELACHCEKTVQTVKCGTKAFSCKNICGKKLNCGKHLCEKICHEGGCQPCEKDPQRMIYCPCGHSKIEKLLGHPRKDCTDPIPVCDHVCGRFLPCGKHQCQKKCHEGPCDRCEMPAYKECRCGRDKMQVPCYMVNYPEEKRETLMTPQEMEAISSFRCKKVCNKHKSCNKHLCKELCCPVKVEMGRAGDPQGLHLCMITCNKTLECGIHQCGEFCHLGYCKPCKWVSKDPLYCSCGATKIDPPIKCGQPPPQCKEQCKKKLDCGHQCQQRCHTGNCPPCPELVMKMCNCSKEVMPNFPCSKKTYNCGKECGIELKCGHKCRKICHKPGECFESEELLMKSGCGNRCEKQRVKCIHKCQELCHPGKECPDVLCTAEMRHYCACGNRYVQIVCKSVSDRPPLECDNRCLKKQRDSRIAKAFGTEKDFEKNKDMFKFTYYPSEAIEFAIANQKFVWKVENALCYVVLNKGTKSFTGLTSAKRNFLTMLAYETFHLDMCVYGQQGQRRTTDVFYKEGAKIPEVQISEIVDLIEKGVDAAKQQVDKSTIFEATLNIYNVQKGSTVHDLKNFLEGFKNEFYTEMGKQMGSFHCHFYSKVRAKDAVNYIKDTPNQFTNCDLVLHKKEIGISTGLVGEESKSDFVQKKRKIVVEDDDGWSTMK